MGLEESDEEKKSWWGRQTWSARSKNEAEGQAIFHSKRNGNVDFKNGTIRHSWPFLHYKKEKN